MESHTSAHKPHSWLEKRERMCVLRHILLPRCLHWQGRLSYKLFEGWFWKWYAQALQTFQYTVLANKGCWLHLYLNAVRHSLFATSVPQGSAPQCLLHLYLNAVCHSLCYICTSMLCATVLATSVPQCSAPQSLLWRGQTDLCPASWWRRWWEVRGIHSWCRSSIPGSPAYWKIVQTILCSMI